MRDYYKTGIQTQTRIGAAALNDPRPTLMWIGDGTPDGPVTKPSDNPVSTWTISDYNAEARRLAAGAPGKHVVVAFQLNGAKPQLVSDDDKAKVRDQWDKWTENPLAGGWAYVGLFDKDQKENGGMIDEGFFVAQESKTTHFTKQTIREESRVGLGWIVGGVLAGLGAVLGFMLKKKGTKA